MLREGENCLNKTTEICEVVLGKLGDGGDGGGAWTGGKITAIV